MCVDVLMYWFGHGLVTVLFFSVTIDSLYKVTEGRRSDIFHRHADGNFDPGCCFTIYHGNHMDSLDLVTSNAEEARTWVTGLRYLMAGISDEDSLAKRQRTHDQYPLYEQRCVDGWRNGRSSFLIGCISAVKILNLYSDHKVVSSTPVPV